MRFIVEHEGLLGLFKGIGPQIMKGLLVQGFLMMTKERYAKPTTSLFTTVHLLTTCRIELTFILFFRYIRQLRAQQLQKLADLAAEKARLNGPVLTK